MGYIHVVDTYILLKDCAEGSLLFIVRTLIRQYQINWLKAYVPSFFVGVRNRIQNIRQYIYL